MGNARKAAAAITAVLHYIKTKEEAIGMQAGLPAASPTMPLISQAPAPVVKPWGLSGRQAQMQMRNLMQLRAFRKL
jgi:hypothetical protein